MLSLLIITDGLENEFMLKLRKHNMYKGYKTIKNNAELRKLESL